MGIINKGILGPVSGKVGTVIGANWKGIHYLRSQSSSRRTTFTQPQLEQHARFSITVSFLRSMAPLLSTSFHDFAKRMTGFNNAVAYTLKNAITGTYPAYTIDYSKALVSRGDLPSVISEGAVKSGTGVLFTWVDNTGIGKAKADDKALLVVYCPALNECTYSFTNATRASGVQGATIEAGQFGGNLTYTYLAFVSADGKDTSNSFYTGTVTM